MYFFLTYIIASPNYSNFMCFKLNKIFFRSCCIVVCFMRVIVQMFFRHFLDNRIWGMALSPFSLSFSLFHNCKLEIKAKAIKNTSSNNINNNRKKICFFLSFFNALKSISSSSSSSNKSRKNIYYIFNYFLLLKN